MKRAAVLILLSACSPLTATWEGDCDYGADEVQVELELVQDGDDITGEGTIGYIEANTLITVELEVDGEKDGEDVEMDLETDTLGDMVVDAILTDRNTLSGECFWNGEGVFELERVD